MQPLQPNFNSRPRIDAAAIKAQCHLIETIRQIKSELLLNPPVFREGVNNWNCKVGEIAYLKVGCKTDSDGFDIGVSILECLMWDVAVTLGINRRFVPTGMIKVENAKTEKREKVDGVVKKSLIEQGTLYVSVQPIQRGNQLNDSSIVSDELFLEELAISLVLGEYDHHLLNLIVDPETGILMNFDNSLSFPPFNEMLKSYQLYIPSVKPSFIGLKNGSIKLTEKHRQTFSRTLHACKFKINELEKFFNSFLTKKRMKIFSPGWFNSVASIQAMKDRIEWLEKAIQTPKAMTSRDLVISTFHSYRFSLAFVILAYPHHSKEECIKLNGIEGLVVEMNKVIDAGYPVSRIKALIDNYTDFDDWFNKLRNISPDYTEKFEGKALIVEMKRNAVLECKELPRHKCVKLVERSINDRYEKWGIFTNGVGEKVIPFDGEQYPVDTISFPGKIVIKASNGELPPLRFEELHKGLPVLAFLNELEESEIKVKVVKHLEREKVLNKLKPYKCYVEQISGAETPQFSLVYRASNNFRILPIRVLNVDLVKMMLPPLLKPREFVMIESEVEIEGYSYKAKTDIHGLMTVKVEDGELPPMTRTEFDKWVEGPKPEMAILRRFNQFFSETMSEKDLEKRMASVDPYLMVQIKGSSPMQFRCIYKNEQSVKKYKVEFEYRKDEELNELEEVIKLTDSKGYSQLIKDIDVMYNHFEA